VAALLVAYYEDLVVLRYPDTEYGQVIVIGYRRQHYKNPSKEEIEATQKLAKVEPLMLEAVSSPRYTLLPAEQKEPAAPGSDSARWTTPLKNLQMPLSRKD